MKDGGSRNAADGGRNVKKAKFPIVGRVLLKGHHVGGAKYRLDPRWSLAISQNGEELGEGTSLKRSALALLLLSRLLVRRDEFDENVERIHVIAAGFGVTDGADDTGDSSWMDLDAFAIARRETRRGACRSR